jgi:hypothetical protein
MRPGGVHGKQLEQQKQSQAETQPEPVQTIVVQKSTQQKVGMRPGGVHGKQLEQNGVTKVERKGQEQVQSKLKEPVQPR